MGREKSPRLVLEMFLEDCVVLSEDFEAEGVQPGASHFLHSVKYRSCN